MAIDIDGAFDVGAFTSTLSPAPSVAFTVVGPNAAMRVGPSSKGIAPRARTIRMDTENQLGYHHCNS